MFRKFFIFLISLLVFVVFGIYFCTRPPVLAKIIKVAINTYVVDFKFQDLAFDTIHVGKNGFITIEKLRFSAVYHQNEKWQGTIATLQLNSLKSFFEQKKLIVNVSRANVQSKDIQLTNIFLTAPVSFDKNNWQISNGDGHIESLETKGIALTQVQTKIKGNQERLSFDPWQAGLVGGNIKGILTIENGVYSLHVDLRQVDLSNVAQFKKTIFGEMHGQLEGTIDLQGKDKEIRNIQGYLRAPSGEQMPASILQLLLPYIPPSIQRNLLSQLIAEKRSVFFDQANTHFKNIRHDSMKLQVKLLSEKLNLDMGVTVDLNVDGGLNNLFGRFNQFSP